MRTDSASDGLTGRRRYLAILAVSAGTALAVIDATIPNVALPTIARVLGIPSRDAVLVVSVYQLVLLMTLLPFSALGDRIGHRRMYQLGQAVFLAASVVCYFATSLPLLLFGRALQGLGAAGALSVSSALVRSIYPAGHLGRGLGLNSMVVAAAAAMAPSLGGAILSVAPWQLLFTAAVPFALISLTLGQISLPRSSGLSERYDHCGALLHTAVFGLIIGGLQAWSFGRNIGATMLAIVSGVFLAAVYLRQQKRVDRPMIPFDLFRTKPFTMSVLGQLLAFAAQMILLVSLPFRLQQSYGWTTVEVGVVLSIWPLILMIVSPVAGLASDRISAGLLGILGMAIAVTGFISMALLPRVPSVLDTGLRMALCGLGFGLFLTPNARAIIGSAPHHRAAAAGGMMATTRLAGQTLGVSVAGGLLALGLGTSRVPASASAVVAIFIGLLCLATFNADARPKA